MHEKLLLRELYGKSAYVTLLPDGQKIPWVPLSVGDYLYYEGLLQSGRYPIAFLEDEIFKKCILNPVLTKQIDKLRAGIVSTVVADIMDNSAPQNIQQLEYVLNMSRQSSNMILHDMVNLVCQAYPAYKPEDIYGLDITTFMLRVATAERKLLNTGILQQPLTFDEPNRPSKKSRIPEEIFAKPPVINAAHEYKKQNAPARQTVITKDEIAEHQAVYTGHEKEDKIILEQQMLKDTVGIYGDYIQQMKEGKKVQIKTPEERKAAALARAEESKKALTETIKKYKQAGKAELERLAKVRKIKRTVRRR